MQSNFLVSGAGIALVGLLAAAPAMAEDQFDLVCKGRQRISAIGRWSVYENRYRIDLAAKSFCYFSCKGTEAIAHVEAGRIDFQKSDKNEPGNVTLIHYVDRSDGKLVYLFSGGSGTFQEVEARCEVAAFSGFPQPKF